MHETVTALLDTSIIAALALYDSAQLPETFFMTAITLVGIALWSACHR
jgi:hypothetical protein